MNLNQGWSTRHNSPPVNWTPLLFVCTVLLLTSFVCSGGHCFLHLSSVSFCDNINHTLLFFPSFSFWFLSLHFSWACSTVFLPCLSLAALWQLLKSCLSWGKDPRTKTRPRPSTGAPCVRSPIAVLLIFHCLHSLSSYQSGDISKGKSLISADLQYESVRATTTFRFLSLKLRLKPFFGII